MRDRELRVKSDPGLAVKFLLNALAVASAVFFISDFLYTDREMNSLIENLNILSRRHDLVCLRLIDPVDRTIPHVGMLRMQDSELIDCVICDSHDERFSRAYDAITRKRTSNLRRIFRKFGLRLIDIRNGCNIESAVVKSLDKRLASA
jgi:hypothetical protein